MSGAAKNRERGERGGQVILDVVFYKFNGGPKTDDDQFWVDGTLPRVRIYNPQGVVVANSTLPGSLLPGRNGVGEYEYVYPIPQGAEISDQWRILWEITIGGVTFAPEEYFAVVETGDAEFDENEYRQGFAFNNPDLTNTHHGQINIDGEVRGWGMLVTPDELRYMVGFGSKLVSPDAAQTYDNNMLQWYIDVAIALVEQDLNIDLIPRVVRHVDPVDQRDITNATEPDPLVGSVNSIRTEGAYKPRQDLPNESDEPNRVREDPYPYRPNPDSHFGYVKLRRRPLRQLLKAILTDPQQNGMVNIYNWRKEKTGFESAVQFFPPMSAIQSLYIASSTEFFARQGIGFVSYPAALWLDYITGYPNAKDVPIDFRGVITWIAGILLLSDYGDGKSPGIASASINLNSISEAYSTTQSATNALYGARIIYFKENVKDWYKKNKNKYQRAMIGIL